jgi:catechol 2,3-dioxygenase-like lactoylglutathione lyase family enzyme
MSQTFQRRAFLSLTGVVLIATRVPSVLGKVPVMLDHILVGCNDLERGIAFVEEKTGVRAWFGGVHPGRGTRNALLSLGRRRYLEIIAPDPEQSGTALTEGRDLRKVSEPRLVGWAEHTDNIEELAKRFRESGIEAEGPRAGSRKRPDGRVLNWKTMNLLNIGGGFLPFFIEWSKSSLHPSADAPSGCRLDRFRLVSSDLGEWRKLIRDLGIDLPLERGEKTQLVARIVGPKGTLEAHS